MADGNLTYIDVKEFTDNVTTNAEFEVTGAGIFDAFMDTATKHLTAQLEAGRLRGEDYATAYIQVYTATLQAALQAWLQKGTAEKQAELLEAQADSEKSKTDLNRQQIELLAAQIELLGAQVISEESKSDLNRQQIELVAAQVETQLMQPELLAAQIELLNAQVASADKQIELIAAQVVSEEAKKNLYRRQIEGFDEDYKHKILKVCMDSWAVGFSVARDSFEASGIPAPMQKVTIDDLYNQYVVTELDSYSYNRPTG